MNDDELDPEIDPRRREGEPQPPVEIPPERLSAAALAGVIDAFVLREGTDYGEVECSHATKVGQIRRQLERGEVKIVYDPNTESVTLVPEREWRSLAGG
ncbi:MAG TPA: YheU family protein [Polyangiaceae bacterium]|nr:YheU family protein [Polyangiaceae bacterium]